MPACSTLWPGQRPAALATAGKPCCWPTATSTEPTSTRCSSRPGKSPSACSRPAEATSWRGRMATGSPRAASSPEGQRGGIPTPKRASPGGAWAAGCRAVCAGTCARPSASAWSSPTTPQSTISCPLPSAVGSRCQARAICRPSCRRWPGAKRFSRPKKWRASPVCWPSRSLAPTTATHPRPTASGKRPDGRRQAPWNYTGGCNGSARPKP